jgi:hypothetical protein
MQQNPPEIDDSISQFKERMTVLAEELHSINRVLGSQDLLTIEWRTRELLRRAKGLLDGNINILFHGQPARIYEDLYRHIEWAEGHLNKAFSEEYEFESIRRRLYMATSLTDYVIKGVATAVQRLS